MYSRQADLKLMDQSRHAFYSMKLAGREVEHEQLPKGLIIGASRDEERIPEGLYAAGPFKKTPALVQLAKGKPLRRLGQLANPQRLVVEILQVLCRRYFRSKYPP
jgi:hypothetical protein